MDRAARDVDEVAGPGRDRLVAEAELDLALEEVEGLVLAAVNAAAAATGWYERLHGEVRAAGLLPGDEKRVVVASPQ